MIPFPATCSTQANVELNARPSRARGEGGLSHPTLSRATLLRLKLLLNTTEHLCSNHGFLHDYLTDTSGGESTGLI